MDSLSSVDVLLSNLSYKFSDFINSDCVVS